MENLTLYRHELENLDSQFYSNQRPLFLPFAQLQMEQKKLTFKQRTEQHMKQPAGGFLFLLLLLAIAFLLKLSN